MTSPDRTRSREVLLLLFDEVEVLDFAGPFEVFSVCEHKHPIPPFRVRTVARTHALVRARNGLHVQPDLAFDDATAADIVVVPGGYGTRSLLADPIVLDWLLAVVPTAELTLSVCTGALLLGAAGLLRGLQATTHHGAFSELRDVAPETRILEHARVVDNGAIITAAGISAGIDAALHVVSRLEGLACAERTAHYMEYDWHVGRGLMTPAPDAPTTG
ncbi:MAG: DJ-1/PfpI family protein [Gemmatimonadaceae bacterium]|jgi:transcriptional regulator GlxA family with amidase domain|nr:DJ-1/PfpI family protein [Gemmatimonadaceae bacterium]